MYKNTPNKHVFHKLQPKQKHLPGLKNITKYFYNLIFYFFSLKEFSILESSAWKA